MISSVVLKKTWLEKQLHIEEGDSRGYLQQFTPDEVGVKNDVGKKIEKIMNRYFKLLRIG